MWMIIIVGFIIIYRLVPAGFVYQRNMFSSFLFFPGLVYWTYFFIGAIMVHRKAGLSVDKIDRLVVEGVYAKVRHPIYSADIILIWAIFFFYPSIHLFLASIWLTIVQLLWSRREEKSLIEKFGNEYIEYMKRVPGIFPKLL